MGRNEVNSRDVKLAKPAVSVNEESDNSTLIDECYDRLMAVALRETHGRFHSTSKNYKEKRQWKDATVHEIGTESSVAVGLWETL